MKDIAIDEAVRPRGLVGAHRSFQSNLLEYFDCRQIRSDASARLTRRTRHCKGLCCILVLLVRSGRNRGMTVHRRTISSGRLRDERGPLADDPRANSKSCNRTRRSIARNQSVICLLSGCMAALITEVASVTSRARNRSLPALLIPPIRCLPAVECSFGARLIQAARGAPIRTPWDRSRSPTSAR